MVAAAMAAFSASRAGNAAEAQALLEHITSVIKRMQPTTYAQGVVIGYAGSTVWELEATEYAATYRQVALDLLNAGLGDTGFNPLELFVARMSTLLGDVGEAQDYFERARSRLEGRKLPHIRAILDYDQARALIRAGASDRARIIALLDAALERFRSHGMPAWARFAAEQKELVTNISRSSERAPVPGGPDWPRG